MKDSDQLLLQLLLAEHPGKQGAGEVTFRRTRQDDYNGFARKFRQLGQTAGSHHRSTGADTGQDPLLLHQAASHLDGFIAGHLLHPIDKGEVQVARNKAGADPLDLVGAGFNLFPGQLLADDRRLGMS